MIKKFVFFLNMALLLFAGSVTKIFADDFVANGAENINLYGNPRLISSSNSAAGGPLFSAGSYSLISNPALPAALQCPVFDFGFAVPISNELLDTTNAGFAFQTGFSMPTSYGVFTGVVQGDFLDKVMIGSNIVLGHLGFARDLTENFYLGISLSGGALFGGSRDITDVYLAAGAGAWYRIKEFSGLHGKPWLKNLRFGLSLQNLGKTFTKGYGFDGGFPGGYISPKAGAAVNLYDTDKFKLGTSFDITIPTFSNGIMGFGLQAEINNFIFVSTGWGFNVYETAEAASHPVNYPYIGIGFKFSVNTSNADILSKVNQTDINVDILEQSLGNKTHIISAGVGAKFGVEDTTPPEIDISNISYGTSN